jgi:hypothetical protein
VGELINVEVNRKCLFGRLTAVDKVIAAFHRFKVLFNLCGGLGHLTIMAKEVIMVETTAIERLGSGKCCSFPCLSLATK